METINPATRFQTIQYFAASDCWWSQKLGQWSKGNKSRLAELYILDRKRNRAIRLAIQSGRGESITLKFGMNGTPLTPLKFRRENTTGRDAKIRDGFLQAAKSNGVSTFIAFCNSPPRGMTANGFTCADADTKVTTNLKTGMERQYGQYLADILTHFRDNPDPSERINFDWVSPINEPQWDWTGKQEGSRAANRDIAREYKAIEERLQAAHLSAHILGPESGSIPDMVRRDHWASLKYGFEFGNYADLLCNPAMQNMLGQTVCYHSYWSGRCSPRCDQSS